MLFSTFTNQSLKSENFTSEKFHWVTKNSKKAYVKVILTMNVDICRYKKKEKYICQVLILKKDDVFIKKKTICIYQSIIIQLSYKNSCEFCQWLDKGSSLLAYNLKFESL